MHLHITGELASVEARAGYGANTVVLELDPIGAVHIDRDTAHTLAGQLQSALGILTSREQGE